MKKNFKLSTPFEATRAHHSSESAEDYVEAISDLILSNGEARICDIANYFGVSHVTVIRSIERLKKKGYIDLESPITLTKAGADLASFCKERHQFLLKFLVTLGVPEEIAAIDVEGMEHHVSEETIKAFQTHLEELNS